MNNNIVFLGGGGHSLVCAEILNQHKELNLIGFVDKNPTATLYHNGYNYLGDDNILEDLIENKYIFFIAIGQLKSPEKRINFYNKIINLGGEITTLISKYSIVSPSAHISRGTILMNGSIINAKANIGKNCIINSNAVIEHETIIESNVHIAPNATILGNVVIREGSFVGAGAIIREGITINKNSIIKAGETVMKNI